MPLIDLLERLGRPQGTHQGREVAVWWRLVYPSGRYETEPWDQASVRLARRGAIALQLVTSPDTPHGAGIMQVPLGAGFRPVFYRVRSMGVRTDGLYGDGNPRLDAIVYGCVREVDRGWNSSHRERYARDFDGTLWCIRPGIAKLDNPVPRRWIDLAQIDVQHEG